MRLAFAFTSLALALAPFWLMACGQADVNGPAAAAGAAGSAGTTSSAGASGASIGGSSGSSSSGGSAVVTAGTEAGGASAGATSAGAGGTAAGAPTSGAGAGAGGAAGAGGQANPEGVPANYQLFIDETFASAASLSKLKFADPQEWVHQDTEGGYVESTGATYTPPHASLHALAIFGDLKFGAFIMDAEVMQTNPSGGHRDFCMAWGMESPSRYYYAHIAEAHDAVAHNIHIVLDADRTAITKTFTPGFAWGTNQWHKLRTTRSAEGDMAIYADGGAMPILTAKDTRLGNGYVGFGSFDDKGRVRNVKVWAPSADQAAAAFFTAK